MASVEVTRVPGAAPTDLPEGEAAGRRENDCGTRLLRRACESRRYSGDSVDASHGSLSLRMKP